MENGSADRSMHHRRIIGEDIQENHFSILNKTHFHKHSHFGFGAWRLILCGAWEIIVSTPEGFDQERRLVYSSKRQTGEAPMGEDWPKKNEKSN